MKKRIKKFIPKILLERYHKTVAVFFAWYYGHPSRQLTVIGVTGTKGKSSTVDVLSHLLELLGNRVGHASTVSFKIGKKKWSNKNKVTMLGRGGLQKLMRDMVKEGCTHAVIETSSEGIIQSRHRNILYDIMVFTNLSPEHIESHGGFEKYKNAKREVFAFFSSLPPKVIKGNTIVRGIVINGNNEHAPDFYATNVPHKVVFGIAGENMYIDTVDVIARDVIIKSNTTQFTIHDTTFVTKLIGEFNVYNILACISVMMLLGTPIKVQDEAVAKLTPIPGRIEFIEEGQTFSVIVDFGYEPAGVRALYKTITHLPHMKIIHVTGSAGGGRDKSRREVLGSIAGKNADIVIVTNEDPYDEDPRSIIEAVACGARGEGKIEGKNLLLIDDRRKAIYTAIAMAKKNDMVLITGKGSERVMMVKQGSIPWDDRSVAREAIRSIVDKV